MGTVEPEGVFDFKNSGDTRALAFSPDGGKVYAIKTYLGQVGQNRGLIQATG